MAFGSSRASSPRSREAPAAARAAPFKPRICGRVLTSRSETPLAPPAGGTAPEREVAIPRFAAA